MKAGRLASIVVPGLGMGSASERSLASELFPAPDLSLDLFGLPDNTKDYTVIRFGFRVRLH
jgi:hypothetical protein